MEETQRYGKFEWVFYIVILPLLFTALLSGIILQFLGFDITGKIASAAREIPVVNSLFPEEEGAKDGNQTAAPDTNQQLQETQDKAQALEKTKTQLENDLIKKNAEIEKLKKQNEAMKKEEATKNATGSGSTQEQAQVDPLLQKAKVYVEMSPAKAAAIMSQLPVTEVKQILTKMSADQQAAILEKMEPAIASKVLSS